jgi:O-antigen/teichoic acid export membrane protein
MLLEPGETLSQRVVRGGFWVFGLRIASRGLSLVRTIVLARLLVPEDFGLMGIAMLAMSILGTFSETGFQAALIQKEEDIKDYLDTAWTVSALRGLVLFAVLYLAAPYIARFFESPAAAPIVRFIGVSMLLNGLTNIGVVYFQKELAFDRDFIYHLSGTLTDLLVAVAAALLLGNAWALVIGLVVGNLVRCIVSYLVHPYRPRLRFDLSRASGLVSFGRWVFGSSIVVFLATQGDDIFLGKALGASALGLYQMAFRLSTVMSSEIAGTISKVTFPAYSKLQGDIGRLSNAYLRTIGFSTFITSPLAGGLFILAPEITALLLGEKWLLMVPGLRVLALMGMVRSIVGTGGAIVLGIGKARWDFIQNLVRVVVIAVTIYPLTMLWGIRGTALSTLLGIGATIPIWLHVSLKATTNKLVDYLKALSPPLLGTVLLCLIVLLFKSLASSFQILELVGAVLIGILTYAVFMIGVETTTDFGLLPDARFFRASLRSGVDGANSQGCGDDEID